MSSCSVRGELGGGGEAARAGLGTQISGVQCIDLEGGDSACRKRVPVLVTSISRN